eukprot:3981523-Prymnesium_polylepis.1
MRAQLPVQSGRRRLHVELPSKAHLQECGVLRPRGGAAAATAGGAADAAVGAEAGAAARGAARMINTPPTPLHVIR